MSRSISVLVIADGAPFDVSYLVARLLGGKIDRERGGVKVVGCGMDMGFALVYNMSSALYPEGFGCVGEHCPASDHVNGDRDHTPNDVAQVGWEKCDACCDIPASHRDDNHGCAKHSHWHRDGGYALRHYWI